MQPRSKKEKKPKQRPKRNKNTLATYIQSNAGQMMARAPRLLRAPHYLPGPAQDAAEQEFAETMFNPERRHPTRWPSPFPFPTAVASGKGTGTVTSNSSGHLVLWLAPMLGTPVNYYNADTITPSNSATSWGTPVSAGTSPMGAAAAGYRVTAAFLELFDTNAVTNRRGTMISCTFPGQYAPSNTLLSTLTIDTLADMYYERQDLTISKSARAIALPTTNDAATWDSGAPQNWGLPAIVVLGGVPSAAYTYRYQINYEYLPFPGNTDLLAVEIAPEGGVETTMRKVRRLATKHLGSIATAGLAAFGYRNRNRIGRVARAGVERAGAAALDAVGI